MKVNKLVVLLLIALGIAITTGYQYSNNTQTPSARFNVKDLPEHGLSIISAADPMYESLLETLTKGESNTIVESLRPFSIFIKNSSSHNVVGCTLVWEFMRPDGKITTHKSDFITLWTLTGTKISSTSENVLRPNSSWFFTPSSFEVRQDIHAVEGIVASPQSKEYLNKLRAELSQYTNITVSIDGVFFDDGTFAGTDSTGFFSKVKAMRDARLDLLREVEKGLQQGKSSESVFGRTQEIAQGSKVEINSKSSAEDHYTNSKIEAAGELLRMKAASGEAKTIERVLGKLQGHWPELRKL